MTLAMIYNNVGKCPFLCALFLYGCDIFNLPTPGMLKECLICTRGNTVQGWGYGGRRGLDMIL